VCTVRVLQCSPRKQSGNEWPWPGQGEDAASVYGYTGTVSAALRPHHSAYTSMSIGPLATCGGGRCREGEWGGVQRGSTHPLRKKWGRKTHAGFPDWTLNLSSEME
jgi:hypothetical protein